MKELEDDIEFDRLGRVGVGAIVPIKPENKARYPKDWSAIRYRIQQRASNKCEKCGVPNHSLGGRMGNGDFVKALPLGETMLGLEWPEPGRKSMCEDKINRAFLRIIKIVCTVAHLDHTPENCSDDNLRFWCQRCHLAYDHEHHQHNARETRRKGRAHAELFE